MGFFGIDKRFHACWTYTHKAMRARIAHAGGIDNQIIQYRVGSSIMDMPRWKESRDEEFAISTSILYGLESPDEFLKLRFTHACHLQAQALGVSINPAIYRVRPGVKKLI
jgi:hypothetical protein